MWKGDESSPRGALLAGALLGTAAGLKLTAAIYAPAVVIALVIATGQRRSFRPAALICIGWILAFMAVYGWWGALLYKRFHNPVFPFFNSVFKSPWYAPVDISDARFFPNNITEWLFYPFNWAFERSADATELEIRDPRLALAMASLPVIAGVVAVGHRISRQMKFVVAFGALSYVVWLYQFSVLRYAVTIEAVAGTTMAAAIALLAARARRGRFVVAASSLAICYSAIQLLTVYPETMRIPLGETEFTFDMPDLPDGSMIIVHGAPIAFLLPFIDSDNLRFIGATRFTDRGDGYRLFGETAQAIAAHNGPILVLMRIQQRNDKMLGDLGIRIEDDNCRAVTTNMEPRPADMIQICNASKLANAAQPSTGVAQ
jgi:hypothetical protein